MTVVLDLAVAAISLAFLSILGIISGVALPGLFLAAEEPRVLATQDGGAEVPGAHQTTRCAVSAACRGRE